MWWVRFSLCLLKQLTMQFILTCPNGKQIDMSSDVLKQMEKKITRQDVLDRIEFYKSTNKLWKEIYTDLQKQDKEIHCLK
jgi:hypothetical protein